MQLIEQFQDTTELAQGFVVRLDDESETVAFGTLLAKAVSEFDDITPLVMYLYGDLGAGKTTFVRGFLQGLGHEGVVKSPTYTLVEPYQLGKISAYHFDLYRLGDPGELEYIGIREYLSDQALLLFEWPDKGVGMIPHADLVMTLEYDEQGRKAILNAKNHKEGSQGQELLLQKTLQKLAKAL